jgi:hypothetical protein
MRIYGPILGIVVAGLIAASNWNGPASALTFIAMVAIAVNALVLLIHLTRLRSQKK